MGCGRSTRRAEEAKHVEDSLALGNSFARTKGDTWRNKNNDNELSLMEPTHSCRVVLKGRQVHVRGD